MREAINDGLDISKYYQEVMEVAANEKFEELIEGSFFKYLSTERRMEIAALKLEYELQAGEVYNYNYKKFIEPHLINGEPDQEFIASQLEKMNSNSEFLKLLHQRMKDFMMRPEANYVSKPEWVKYFDNIDYVYVDEENKSIIALHEEVIMDVGSELNYTRYSIHSPTNNEKYYCKDIEMNFLVNQEIKKHINKRGGNYPLPKEEFVEYMYGKKWKMENARVYLTDVRDKNIGSEQYFLEQLRKPENKNRAINLCNYTFDFGMILSNPFQETNSTFFEIHSFENEFEFQSGEIFNKGHSFGTKDIYIRKYKKEYNEWIKTLDKETAEKIITQIEGDEVRNFKKYQQKPKLAKELRTLRAENKGN